MPIIGLMVIIVVIGIDSIRQNRKNKKIAEEAAAKGHYRRVDYDFHKDREEFYIHNWLYDKEKSAYPKEYVPYMDVNRIAWADYIHARVTQDELDKGLCPPIIGVYIDARTYNPINGWIKMYGEAVKAYNETGKFQYGKGQRR